MRITAILENTASRADIGAEHGLSLFIEVGGRKILFDMGQTELFALNAQKLGLDISKVDVAVLSHGHYDHGGGIKRFFEENSYAKVLAKKDAFLPHYNGREKYIGLDTSLLESDRFIFVDDEFRIDDSSLVFSIKSCSDTPNELLEKVGEDFVPDDFRHEQYLLLKENEKKVLISGCSHKGILNIARAIDADFIVGGFHFSKRPLDDALKSDALVLGALPCEFYTCHCTGVEQFEFLGRYMRNLHYLACGDTIII